MYKILAIGSASNYFFSEIVKVFSQQHNVVFNDLSMADNVDFIFCVNDIKPVLKTTKVPVVTWIGERPSYPYLNKVLKLRQSDLIFITDKKFVDEVKTIVGHNNVYYLPLATNFSRKKIPLSYNYEISFVGNTMHKQFQSIEAQKELILKLPLKDMDYDIIKKIIMGQCMENLLVNVVQFIDSFSILQQYCNTMEEVSKFKKDIFLGYVGMVITYTIRKSILEELAKKHSRMVVIPSIWKNEIKGICIHDKISYENINEWYNNCKMNLNISSRHMPTALNSRVFDIPICGSMLLTDYREGIEELFSKDEIVTYKTVQELTDYINHYSTKDSERNRIIRNATRKIEKEHRYTNRADFILKKYRENMA